MTHTRTPTADACGERRHTRRRLLDLAGGSTELDEDEPVAPHTTIASAQRRCEIYQHPATESRYRCDGESCSPGGESAGGCGCGDDREELGPLRYLVLVDEHDRDAARLVACGSWRACRAAAAIAMCPPARGRMRASAARVLAALQRVVADRNPGCWIVTLHPGRGWREEQAAVSADCQPKVAHAAALLYAAALAARALLGSGAEDDEEPRDDAHSALADRVDDLLVQLTPGTPHPPHA